MQLDTKAPFPLYYQLMMDLKRKIESGELSPGTLLPAEKELEIYYGVSRATVRNGIGILVQEGLLTRKQGFGTMVGYRRMMESFSRLSSFTEKMENQNGQVSSEVLEKRELPVTGRVADALAIPEGTGVIRVSRLRRVDSEPIAFFTNYLRTDIGVVLEEDFSGSIFRLLEEKFNIRIKSGRKTIKAKVAEPDEAELLDIKIGDALLLIQNTVFDKNNRPIEFSEGVYRGDRYQYEVDLDR